MKCLPAIDILDGKCVRLTKGDFDKSKIYNESPLDQAKIFENAGFKEIHIVDLNGAKSGNRLNLPIISKIASNTGLKIQLGGGIRSIDSIAEASAIESMDLIPPPNWILRPVLDAILEIIGRFKRLPDFAPFKSTMWISLNPAFSKIFA